MSGQSSTDVSTSRCENRTCDDLLVVTVHWAQVGSPESYALSVLREEAPEIPQRLLERRTWQQLMLPLTALFVDESMVADHETEAVHRIRRDRFRQAIHDGAELPPLIAIKSNRHLVDGYARLRALRSLAIEDASVVCQVIP